MSHLNELVFQAASFAARAHKNQLRKDGVTPYFSHPFRVCLVVRQIFGFDDPEMLSAALLHDTLEDTTTDFDDLSERFTPKVATWVAALSKDCRKPHDVREAEYYKTLAEADWQVKAIKLADLYDNSNDSKGLSLRQMQSTWEKSRFYLDAIRTALPDSLVAAFQLVERRLDELKSSLTT